MLSTLFCSLDELVMESCFLTHSAVDSHRPTVQTMFTIAHEIVIIVEEEERKVEEWKSWRWPVAMKVEQESLMLCSESFFLSFVYSFL